MRLSVSAASRPLPIIDFMKYFILIVGVTLTAGAAQAQRDTVSVKTAAAALEQALMNGDSAALQGLLHPDLLFGHSNGWIQTKREVIRDMNSGYLKYNRFVPESVSVTRFRRRAVIKAYVSVNGERDHKPFDVRLFVMQEWVQTKNGWQLILRQGARQQ